MLIFDRFYLMYCVVFTITAKIFRTFYPQALYEIQQKNKNIATNHGNIFRKNYKTATK